MNVKGIKSNRIVINGKEVSGRSIFIRDGKVFVDGKEVDNDEISNMFGSSNIKIEINGDVEQVDVLSGDVVVIGSVGGSVSTVSHDVAAGSIYSSFPFVFCLFSVIAFVLISLTHFFILL